MNKKQVLLDAYNAGQNDTYISQSLNESAGLYFENEVEEIEDDDERDKLMGDVINAYNDGFMYKNKCMYNQNTGTGVKCPLCDQHAKYTPLVQSKKGIEHVTHMYVCQECPFIGLEFIENANISDVAKYLMGVR